MSAWRKLTTGCNKTSFSLTNARLRLLLLVTKGEGFDLVVYLASQALKTMTEIKNFGVILDKDISFRWNIKATTKSSLYLKKYS